MHTAAAALACCSIPDVTPQSIPRLRTFVSYTMQGGYFLKPGAEEEEEEEGVQPFCL